MDYKIASIPGDGIGPEVVNASIPLFEEVANVAGFEFHIDHYGWNSEKYLSNEELIPSGGLDRLSDADGILLGAVGHPQVPDHITLNELLLPIRKGFDQSICKRPATLYEGIECPIRTYSSGDIDFVVYRENTEGEYANVGGREHSGFENEVAIQSAVFTRRGTERIIRAAFEAAVEREGKLTSITKSNAQAHSMVFWDEMVQEVSKEYPNVVVESLLVDAASMDLIRRPDEFDIIVASNLFGDILTDLSAVITGGMGLAPSGNINPDGNFPSMFEPVHGSAPDIAGDGIANPLATVLSGAMLFDHIGEETAANQIRNVVKSQLSDSEAPRTPDLGGEATTEEIANDLQEMVST